MTCPRPNPLPTIALHPPHLGRSRGPSQLQLHRQKSVTIWCSPALRWSMAVVVVSLMAWTAVGEATQQYYVEFYRRGGPSLSEQVITNDTKTTPPAAISGDYQASDGTNTFRVPGYSARSDWHEIGLTTSAATYAAYNAGAEWWTIARWRWDDVVFSCQDGRALANAALRIRVKGAASGFSFTYQLAPNGAVSLYLGHPQYLYTQGVWNAEGNNSWPNNSCILSPPYTCSPNTVVSSSTGVFSGSTGNGLDRTVNFLMGEPPSPQVQTGVPILVAPQFTLTLSALNEYVSANFSPSGGGGISLPTDGPVFDLPSGCTCNSEQMGLIDNRIAYRISASAESGGTIGPSGTVVVNHGSDQVFAIAADPCHTIQDVLVDGVSVGAVSSYVFSSVTSAHSIQARFSASGPSAVSASAGPGGTISPNGPVPVTCGGTQSFSIAPAACYHIADVLVDGVSVGPVATYAFDNVTSGHTIAASFALDGYTIAASAGTGGTVEPSGSIPVSCGSSHSFTIMPADCHHVADVLIDGVSVGPVGSYVFTGLTSGHTVVANFALDGFEIAASAGPGGSIDPSGPIPVNCGSDQVFSITPDFGYSVADVVVDGVSVGAVGTYALADIRSNHTVAASFSGAASPLAVTINSPASGAIFSVNTSVPFQGAFSGDLPGSTHVATWTIGSVAVAGNVSEGTASITANHIFATPGVYMVRLTVTSSSGASATTSEVGGLAAMVVVYDPNGGFVTGGGWINSPAGAYVASPSMTGKASFGFESKYKHGATTPTGQTTFQFKTGNLSFSSESYDWLVVAGSKAMYKGLGKVNGSGSYGFLLSAIDGALENSNASDKFRIKIWDAGNGDALVYDNQLGGSDTASATTAIGGGSIVIHKGSSGAPNVSASQGVSRDEAQPQHFGVRAVSPGSSSEARTQFDLPEEASVRLSVFDLRGRRVADPVDGVFAPGSHEVAWNGRDRDGRMVGPGIYFVRMEARSIATGRAQTATVKIVRTR